MIYVVRRSFKCFGKCFIPGDVIHDVTEVKGLKSKLVDHKIIEVTEQTYESTKRYFNDKFGVDLKIDEFEVKPSVVTEAVKGQAAKVQAAKVQVAKVQVAKVQATKVQVAKV